MSETTGFRCLAAESRAAPAELVRAVLAAVGAEGLTISRVDLGKIGDTGSRLGRVVQALMGEAEAGRLLREARTVSPDVALAFDAGALAALALIRERKVAETAVIGVVPDLAPARNWGSAADRYLVVDDEAAVLLEEHGVDGARVLVVGPIVPHAWAEAAIQDRAALRAEHKVASDVPVVVVDAAPMTVETVQQLLLQLSLLGRGVFVLFDAGGNAGVAETVRRQVPTFGIRGKLFGETPKAPRLWRTADVVLARPTPKAVHAALALGCPLVALEPDGERQEREANALAERGLGAVAPQLLFVGGALDPFVKDPRRLREAAARVASVARGDGAARVAKLVLGVAQQKDEVIAESAAYVVEPAAEEESSASPPRAKAAAAGEPEDLDDLSELVGDGGDGDGVSSAQRRAAGNQARLRKEVDDARAEATRWDERAKLAREKGDRGLAETAQREADRKRARMHAALQELARVERTPPPPRQAPEDPLAAFKKRMAQSGTAPRSPEEELAELKRKMQGDRGPKR
jgi:UDP-N-acetylglucosamine:LPS N-acetylglucosamine transferase